MRFFFFFFLRSGDFLVHDPGVFSTVYVPSVLEESEERQDLSTDSDAYLVAGHYWIV